VGALHGVVGHFDLVPPPTATGSGNLASSRIGIGVRESSRNDPPRNHDAGDPNARADFFQNDGGGYFKYEVNHFEGRSWQGLHRHALMTQHLPGDEAWLIGEQRASGEKKYYLANLPAVTDLRTLAATIKARWICEQARRCCKKA
jgi:hypothetical protein